jgi:hypothetical protein
MKKILNGIGSFFTLIDYTILGKSLLEVGWLTLITLFPLIINITIAALAVNDLLEPIRTRILPGEMLSYCLGFLAPSLYLLTKTQGSNYKLPLLHGFSILTLLLYVSTIVLYLITKNKWVPQINLEPHNFDMYFKLAACFFFTSIGFRVYAIYHGRNLSSYAHRREQQQQDFNTGFANSLNIQK